MMQFEASQRNVTSLYTILTLKSWIYSLQDTQNDLWRQHNTTILESYALAIEIPIVLIHWNLWPSSLLLKLAEVSLSMII